MRLFSALAAALALLTALPAWADRPFPAGAKRGLMTPAYAPDIFIDGKPRRLAPSARIFNQDNLIEMPASLRGQNIVVNYEEDRDGLIFNVWILTPEEARITGK
ncbi:hypothetical protein GCM10027277_19210 [Pseudoduganella ginsengisoli]|uniref:Uncharacterized protein n=1 Tax=Pseudoduganella ginsengisoli TaxID=1462440 RepID=A0A6L6PW20_9BURK|nr:hypothetical protein [Pseudoduganella ginsengisoli]MTW00822.1 hypothetical protein [Pseudoduganella ginsengisoli]